MPQVNLSTLNGRELRQLLDASRRRGDASLSYSVLQEMAERRSGHSAQRAAGIQPPTDSRLVAVDLGDPADKSDDLPPMPNWRPPEAAGADPGEAEADAPTEFGVQPAQAESVVDVDRMGPLEADRPLSLRSDDAWPDQAAGMAPPQSRPAPRPRKQARSGVSFPVFAAFTVGIGLGTGFGWLAGGIARDVLPEPVVAAAPMRPAALAPAATPPPPAPEPVVTEPAPQAEDAAAAPLEPTAPPAPDVQESAPVVAESDEPPAEAAPGDASEASSASAACAAEATPADRAICGDPQLQSLQRRLRQAYAEALDAHQDRDLLRQRQLAWRDGRNAVSDPARLAALYEQRIRKLNAATAEARRQR